MLGTVLIVDHRREGGYHSQIATTVHPPGLSAMAAAATAVDLALGYGPTTVLDGATFDIPGAAVTALIGPNGAGKSTLLNALAGLLPARAGRLDLPGPRRRDAREPPQQPFGEQRRGAKTDDRVRHRQCSAPERPDHRDSDGDGGQHANGVHDLPKGRAAALIGHAGSGKQPTSVGLHRQRARNPDDDQQHENRDERHGENADIGRRRNRR